MSSSPAGKGDKNRPVNRKKWDAWWERYKKRREAQEQDAGTTNLHETEA